MRISERLVMVAFVVMGGGAMLLAACGDETDPVGGEQPGDEVDAAPVATVDAATPTAPDANLPTVDAAPVPDSEPGAPDASPADAAPPAVSFSADVMPILMARCGGCHLKDTAGAGGLSFGVQGQLAYLSLVDQPTHNTAVGCVNLKLVDTTTDDATASSLYLKIAGDTCGTRMPKGSNATPLPDEQLQLFARWIAEGAQNN
jgi:hypothetical protein